RRTQLAPDGLQPTNGVHGAGVGRVSSIFPDLRYAAALNAEALFKAIVIDGALQNNGMVSFAEQLTPEDAEAIRAYVVSLANAELQARAAPPAVPAAEVHCASRRQTRELESVCPR